MFIFPITIWWNRSGHSSDQEGTSKKLDSSRIAVRLVHGFTVLEIYGNINAKQEFVSRNLHVLFG